MSIKEISCLGSCASRMIFNENFSKDYKKWFHINFSVEGQSLVSLMSEPLKFDSNLLTSDNPFENKCVESDLSKNFLKFLKKDSIDYLVMDTYFDVYNLYQIQNKSFITNTARLHNTDIFDTLKISKKISPFINFEEFFILWKRACDLFFEFIKNFTNIKIVLNPSRLVYRYKDANGKILINQDFMHKSFKQNYIRNILETYLLINYDVDLLPFRENTLLDVNHIFGFTPTHYDEEYYPEKINQLKEIDFRNNILNNIDFGGMDLNNSFRKLRRENTILKFKRDILNYNDYNNIKFNSDKVYNNISKCRIDMINSGDKSNSIEIISSSDENLIINHPKWFVRDDGQGIETHSSKGNINLRIKCNGNGILKIILRGIHKLGSDNMRLPISIRLQEVMLNDVVYLNGSKIIWHDNPLIITKSVSDSEIIDMHIEWFLYNSCYNNY